MFRFKKNKNIICTLRDRELGTMQIPYKLSLNILSQLVQSDHSAYESTWTRGSSLPVVYDSGLLYFNHHQLCYSIYGFKGEPSLTKLSRYKNSVKAKDVISYSSPVFKTCRCKSKLCYCLSRFIFYITEDNWLYQQNPISGFVCNEAYIKRADKDYKFKYCDWNVYAEEVVLSSKMNPDDNTSKTDVVANLALFTVFPFEFKAMLEIKRSVFGKACNHVNVSFQLMILGMSHDRVHIYSFEDVLSRGSITPYKFGDPYMTGKVGSYPIGLPLNCNLGSAPPLLFDVQCFGQSVDFGGVPYHYMYSSLKNQFSFMVTQLQKPKTKSFSLESNVWDDEPNIVYFHPDKSNRILCRESEKVRCFQLVDTESTLTVEEIFTMGFSPVTSTAKTSGFSSFGRRIKKMTNLNLINEKCIMAVDYEDELDMLGVLGVCPGDPMSRGFIKLYDSFTGKEVKCVNINRRLCETNQYQLIFDLDVLIIIEKTDKRCNAILYNLKSIIGKNIREK